MRETIIKEIIFLEEELLEIIDERGLDRRGIIPATVEDLQKESNETLISYFRRLIKDIHEHVHEMKSE